MTRVVVHIDRLVVTGFGNEHAHAVGDAMCGELARLLTEPTAGERLASLGHLSRLDAGRINLAQGVTPQRLGICTGRAIAKGMSR
jgi:hypothetical protein